MIYGKKKGGNRENKRENIEHVIYANRNNCKGAKAFSNHIRNLK